MARKTEKIVIEGKNNRDAGKTFLITEMPPRQAEEWAIQVILAAGRGGANISDALLSGGFSALGMMAFQSFLGMSWQDAKPLLDEMMECVKHQPNPEKDYFRKLDDADFEEISTRLFLKKKVWDLHIDFLNAAEE